MDCHYTTTWAHTPRKRAALDWFSPALFVAIFALALFVGVMVVADTKGQSTAPVACVKEC